MGILDNLIASKAAPSGPPSSPYDVSPPPGMAPEDVKARLELNSQRESMGVPTGHLLAQLHNEGWTINAGTPDFTNIDNSAPGKPILSSLIEQRKAEAEANRVNAPELGSTGVIPLTGNELRAIPAATLATAGNVAQGVARFIPEGIAKAGMVGKNLVMGTPEKIAPEAAAIEQFGRLPIDEWLLKTPEEKAMATGMQLPLQVPGMVGKGMGNAAVEAGLPPSVAAAASIVPDVVALALFPGIRKSFKNVVGAPVKAGVEAAASKIAGKIPKEWLYTEETTTKGWTRDQIRDHLSGKADIDGTMDPLLKESLMKMTPEQWKDLIRPPKESASWTSEQLNDWLTNNYGIEIARIVTRDPTWLGKIFGIKPETITETFADSHGRPTPRPGTGPEPAPPPPETPPEPPKSGPEAPPPNEWETKFAKDSQKTYKSEAAANRKAQNYRENGVEVEVQKTATGFVLVRKARALPGAEAPAPPPPPETPPPAGPAAPQSPQEPRSPAPPTPTPTPEPIVARGPADAELAGHFEKAGMDAKSARTAGKYISDLVDAGDVDAITRVYNGWSPAIRAGLEAWWGRKPESPNMGYIGTLVSEKMGGRPASQKGAPPASTAGSEPGPASPPPAGAPVTPQRQRVRPQRSAYQESQVPDLQTVDSDIAAVKSNLEEMTAEYDKGGSPGLGDRIKAYRGSLEELTKRREAILAGKPPEAPVVEPVKGKTEKPATQVAFEKARAEREPLPRTGVAPEVAKPDYQAEADAIGATPPIKHIGEMGGRQMFEQGGDGVGNFTKKPEETVAQAFEAAKARFEKPAVAPEVAKEEAIVKDLAKKAKGRTSEDEIRKTREFIHGLREDGTPKKEPPPPKPSQHSILGQLKGRIKIPKEEWNARRIFENGLAPYFTTKPTGMQFDKKIQELVELGILPEGADLDTFIEKLQTEQKARRRGEPVGPPTDNQTDAAGQEYLRKEAEKEKEYDLQPINTAALEVGDIFKIRDEEYEVVEERENGDLMIQDGEMLTLAADSEVYVNGGMGGVTKTETPNKIPPVEKPATPSQRLAGAIEDLIDEKVKSFKLDTEEAPAPEKPLVPEMAGEQPELFPGQRAKYKAPPKAAPAPPPEGGLFGKKPTKAEKETAPEQDILEKANEILPQALVNLLDDAGLEEFTDDWLHDRVEGWVGEGKENPEDGTLPEWVTPVSRQIVDIMKTRGYVAAVRKAALAGTFYKITRKGEDAILKITEPKGGGDSTLYSGFPLFDPEVWKRAFPNGLDDVLKDLRERRRLAKGAIRDDLGWFNATVNTPYYVFVDKHPEGKPVFDRARRAFQEREDITAELSELIDPYARLSQADQKPINKALIRGRYRRKVYTNDELRDRHHLTDPQIEAYRGVRAAMDRALTLFEDAIVYRLTNGQIPNASELSMDMLADLLDQLYNPAEAPLQGEMFGPSDRLTNDKIKFIIETIDKIRAAKRTGYIPFTRFGDYAFGMKKVVDGRPGPYTYWATAESGWKAGGEFQKLKKRFAASIDAGRIVPVEPRQMAKNAKRDLIQGVGAFEVGVILQMSGLDVGTNSAFKELIDKLIQEQGFKSHFLTSNDLPGFSTDIERSLADYVIGISGYIARMKAVPEMDKAALPAFKNKPKLGKYYEEWKQYIFSPQEEYQRLRSGLFVYYLGGNIKSMLVNLTQPIVASGPWLTQYVSEARAAGLITKAFGDVTKAIGFKEDGRFGIKIDSLPDDIREHVRKAIREGIISETLVYELMATARKPPVLRKMSKHKQRASYYLGMLFSRAEKVNRMVTMIAALRAHDVIRQQRAAAGGAGGVPPRFGGGGAGASFEDDPYEFGKRAVDETQFIYSKLNRPRIFRKIGALLGVFRSFAINFIEMLSRSWRVSRRAVLNALAMLSAFAGILGLPLANDLKNLMEGIYQVFSHRVPDAETAMRDWGKEVLGDAKWIDVLLHGPFRNIGGDISRSVGQGDVVPGLGGKGNLLQEIVGVPTDIVVRVNRAYNQAMAGDYGRAGEALAPEFIRNPMVAARWAKEGVLNTAGQPIVSKDRLTALDILLKTIGMQPTKVSIAYEREEARDKLRKRLDQAERDLTRRILTAYRKGDEAEAGRLLLTADGIQTGQSAGNGEPEIIPIPHGALKKPEDMVIVSLPNIARMRQEQQIGDKMTGILKQPYMNRPAFLKLNDLYQ